MKKIGLFYGAETTKSAQIAKKIEKELEEADITLVPLETASKKDFESYENIIVGTSTWFDGELPDYWNELLPDVEDANLKGKKVAIFGLGDQKGYPDNFADGIGILANVMKELGASVVGYTSTEGYTFYRSQAQEGDQFCGLVLDYENQSKLNAQRISDWVKSLKKEFATKK